MALKFFSFLTMYTLFLIFSLRYMSMINKQWMKSIKKIDKKAYNKYLRKAEKKYWDKKIV